MLDQFRLTHHRISNEGVAQARESGCLMARTWIRCHKILISHLCIGIKLTAWRHVFNGALEQRDYERE
jgi:hypothetical protein